MMQKCCFYVLQGVVIEMVDARTLELFKGGKGEIMVASGSASRRTGYKGSIRVTQQVVKNVILKRKLADNVAHICMLEEKNSPSRMLGNPWQRYSVVGLNLGILIHRSIKTSSSRCLTSSPRCPQLHRRSMVRLQWLMLLL